MQSTLSLSLSIYIYEFIYIYIYTSTCEQHGSIGPQAAVRLVVPVAPGLSSPMPNVISCSRVSLSTYGATKEQIVGIVALHSTRIT